MRLLPLADEANETREGFGGLFCSLLFTHACRYAERRRLGWGVKRWWLLQAVETLRLGRNALAALQRNLFASQALGGRMRWPQTRSK